MLRTFFEQFWPAFVVTGVFFPLCQIGRRISLQGNAVMLVVPKSFRELRGYSKHDQKQLLHEADGEAFGGWRAILPAVIYAGLFSASLAAGGTISNVAGSLSLRMVFTGACLGLGAWLVRRWEVRSIRPYLTSRIRRTQDAA